MGRQRVPGAPAGLAWAKRQPGPNGRAANGSGLRLLGYYAQDESGRWVWLPAGSESGPPAPPDAAAPPPR